MREGNATKSGKTCGGRARGVVIRDSGLLVGTDVAKTLLAISPTMAGFVTMPTLGGGAVGGWVTGSISAGRTSCVGKKRGKGLSNTIRNHVLDGRGVVGSKYRGPRVSGGFFLGFLLEGALVVDEGLKFCLSNMFRVNVLNPRAV